MASLKDIRTRINSVKSTQKITNAMKLVSAAKFARANTAVRKSRPYAEGLGGMVKRLVAGSSLKVRSDLVKKRDSGKILLVVVSSDRGLCGPLNSGIFKAAHKFLTQKDAEGKKVELVAWGRKSIGFCQKYDLPLLKKVEKVLENRGFDPCVELADELISLYREKDFEEVFILYPKFKSVLEQIPTNYKYLPVAFSDEEDEKHDYIVEPSVDKVVEPLLLRKLRTDVFQIVLEGNASEHGARMTAMDAATTNAKEVIKKLTLQYNRARQAAITTELTEIISGAEALN